MELSIGLFAGVLALVSVFLAINFIASGIGNAVAGEKFIPSIVMGIANIILAVLMGIIAFLATRKKPDEQK